MAIQAPQTEIIEKTINVARAAQIAVFVRENQLLTAAVMFVLWQTGAFLSAMTYVQGGVC